MSHVLSPHCILKAARKTKVSTQAEEAVPAVKAKRSRKKDSKSEIASAVVEVEDETQGLPTTKKQRTKAKQEKTLSEADIVDGDEEDGEEEGDVMKKKRKSTRRGPVGYALVGENVEDTPASRRARLKAAMKAGGNLKIRTLGFIND